MKTVITDTQKQNIKNATAKATSFILGDVHFSFKTAADITAKLEAKIVSKLTDVKQEDVIEDRHNATEKAQADFLDAIKIIKGMCKSKHIAYEQELTYETNTNS